ncbi:MAG: hypothetical protein QM664_00455 [Flavihumibacter sp.]
MTRVIITVFALVFLILSCKERNGYTYAIKDFRKAVQPGLFKIVEKGFVSESDSTLAGMATDEELKKLTHSEHPVLRASAFREMIKRNSFDHLSLILHHLDDTALVATDGGEFGIWYRMVSDDILQEYNWKSQEEKNKVVDEVITRHNYLRAAYLILPEIDPDEKYYPYIKLMATRPRRLSNAGYELDFDDVEYALYGLAMFKKREDVKIIKTHLAKISGS